MSYTAQLEGLAELEALTKIIQTSVASIKATLASKDTQFPSAYTPVTPKSEAPRVLPDVELAASQIISAANQLIFAVRSPYQSVIAVSMQHQLAGCLGVAAAANIAEACREAGPQGAHVEDLARASNVDPGKLARVLRMLATSHIFVEVAPDVFANNRASSALDTGKSVKDLLENPANKHVGTMGIAAAVGHCTDDAMKAASYLQEALLDPKIAASEEPTETPFNLAFNTKKPVWEWFEDKGNEHRLLRFGFTMEGMKHAAPQNTIVEGFDWKGLKHNSVIVDVGGGLGSQSMTLAQTFPHLRFIIQDREPVLKDTAVFWDGHLPDARKTGKVTLQVHDFFTNQPVKDAAVFLLRNIIHDWADKYCVQLLRKLREAATPNTRLVIVDNLMSFACVNEELKKIPGALPPLPPAPLLPNGGHSSTIAYFEDIQMIDMLNGKERTVIEVRELMEQAGWKLAEIHQSSASAFSTQKAIGIPV